MKLYASVSSERATKGQGGNKQLRIVLKGSEPSDGELFNMSVEPDGYGHARIRIVHGSISFLRSLVDKTNEAIEWQLELEQAKGEKEKGECKHTSAQECNSSEH